MTLIELFTNIANAIRTKKGTSDKILASDFAIEIENLPTSGESSEKYFVGELSENNTSYSLLFKNIKKIPNMKIKPLIRHRNLCLILLL